MKRLLPLLVLPLLSFSPLASANDPVIAKAICVNTLGSAKANPNYCNQVSSEADALCRLRLSANIDPSSPVAKAFCAGVKTKPQAICMLDAMVYVPSFGQFPDQHETKVRDACATVKDESTALCVRKTLLDGGFSVNWPEYSKVQQSIEGCDGG